MERALHDGLDKFVPGDVELFVEYMDTKRNAPGKISPYLYDLYEHKYKNASFDVILSSDDNALQFLLDYGDELFPGVPKVFCGVNSFERAEKAHARGFTGVIERWNLAGVFDLALQLLPETERIAMIKGESRTAQANYDRFLEIKPDYTDRVDFIVLSDLTKAEFAKKLADLPPGTVTVNLGLFKTADGEAMSLEQSNEFIVTHSDKPNFAISDMHLGLGPIGGDVISSANQGAMAAEMAAMVLRGVSPADIPVIDEKSTAVMVDYQVLQKHGISGSRIPEGAVVINRPYSFYEENTLLVWAVLAVFFTLSLISTLLAVNIVRLKLSQKAQKAGEEQLKIALSDAQLTGKRLEALLTASNAANSSETFMEAARRIFSISSELIGFTSGYVAMQSEDGLRNEVLFLESGEHTCTVDTTLPMPIRGMRALAYERKEAVYHNDFMNSEWMKLMPAGHVDLESVMFAPLIVEDKVVGLMGVGNKPGGFNDQDAELVTTFAELASLAQQRALYIENLKRSERVHKEAREAAEAGSRAKSAFLANMSHEIRTPLNGIMGMLQLIGTTSPTAEQEDYLQLATEAGKRLTRLLSDILDLSRVEAGRMSIVSEPFDLRSAVQTIEHLFAPVAHQKGLQIRFEVAPSLPDLVQGDSIRLQQILTNLIDNAVKVTTQGSIGVAVHPLPPVSPSDCRLLFSVSDTGPGISDDMVDFLFEAFSQASEGYSKQIQGAGLGLAIVKRLVELLGGNIAVESEEGKGTTVHFTITLKTESSGVRPAEEEHTRISDTPRDVLLVEDDEITRIAVIKLLGKCGHRVEVANDGREALEILKNDSFDMILMDVQMPEMDGVEVTLGIRRGEAGEGNRNVPIIAMTAYAMEGDKEAFLNVGMNAYLAKPVMMDKLQEVLAEMFDEEGGRA